MDRKRMIARIKAITAGFRGPSTPTSEDKATKLARSFKGKMGGINSGQELAMATLLTETSGVDVLSAYHRIGSAGSNVKYPEDKFIAPLVCLVFSADPRGSGVPINKPVVSIEHLGVTGGSRMLKPDGLFSGMTDRSHCSPPANANPYMRLATDTEIEQLTDAQVNYLIGLYTA
jgi:hypothetical protein